MTRILVPSAGLDDWRSRLADPEMHWRPGRSAMAAAEAWEEAAGLPPEIAAILGPDAELLFAIPEHEVALPGGRRASQCDVFALVGIGTETCALAVEAKVDESFGPTLGEWRATPSPGRAARLAAICAALGCAEPPDALRYQLLHRTAAAVLEARRFRAAGAAMIVQSFSPEHSRYEDFAAFCAFLGLAAARGQPLRRPLPDGRALTLGWAPAAGG